MTDDRDASAGATCVGRQREFDQISGALDLIDRRGTGFAVVGEPGVGKSALLAAASVEAQHRGVRVLAASGAEAERHMPFAALHQLLLPILDRTGSLPAAHRSALLGAIGIADAPSYSNHLFIALGALELIADASQHQASLITVDDLQWVDGASLDIVRFVSRRVQAERVVMLLASRPNGADIGPDVDVDVVRIRIEGLDEISSRKVLDRHHPGLSHLDQVEVLEMAAGNPLALMELPIALGLTVGASSSRAGDDVPLTFRLERAFAARIEELDDSTRAVALVAALQGSSKVEETIQATQELLGAPQMAAVFEPLVSAGLLTSDGVHFEFRHPLVRSSVVQRASVTDRSGVHKALARALAEDSDRATWHRAMATSAEDAEIASALEAGAERALARGSPLLAGEWLERSAFMSPDSRDRAHRLLRAAEIAFELGRATTVRRLTSSARLLPLDKADRGRLIGIEAAFDDGMPGDSDHIGRLVDAAQCAHDVGEDGVGVRLLVGAAKTAYWQAADASVVDPIRTALDHLNVTENDPSLIFVRALVDPFVHGKFVMDQLAGHAVLEGMHPAAAGALSNAGFVVGDFSQALVFARRASEVLRQQGRIALLAQTLVLETFASLYLGRWDITLVASAEAHRFAVETDQPVWAACALLGQANVAAVRGDVTAAQLAASTVEQTALITGNRALLSGAKILRGHAALGAQSPAEAFPELLRMTDPNDESYQVPQCVWAIDQLADAAAQVGRIDEARAVLARFDTLVADTPAPGVRRVMALARAILADDEEAEALFHEASYLSVAAAPWHRGRVDLAYGSWLRRRRRVAQSRDRLRSAQLVFDALGAHGWSERAQVELVAAGDRVKPSERSGWDHLSGQELQIAQLAAQGLSNREIGERLYLSHRTVGSHLYRVFPKLGVRSRGQLHGALGSVAGVEP
jgi:DNA-binding CsgD family transcriptional regulator